MILVKFLIKWVPCLREAVSTGMYFFWVFLEIIIVQAIAVCNETPVLSSESKGTLWLCFNGLIMCVSSTACIMVWAVLKQQLSLITLNLTVKEAISRMDPEATECSLNYNNDPRHDLTVAERRANLKAFFFR